MTSLRNESGDMSPVIALAGGGSGGHVAPAIALAEAWTEITGRDDSAIIFSSLRKVDRRFLESTPFPVFPLRAQPFRWRPGGLIRCLRGWRSAAKEATDVMRDRDVRHVVLLGGFVPPPVASAARRLGIETTLLNLDAVPGRANRMLARSADHVRTAVELTNPSRWPGSKKPTGLPLRRAAISSRSAHECRVALGLDPTTQTLLITGASQGAQSIDRFVAEVVRTDRELFHAWQIVHLSRPSAEEQLRSMYKSAGIRAFVESHLDSMGLAWGASDLAISRGGANSIAEAIANRVPSIILPYPFHADQHQARNADPWVALGAMFCRPDHIDPTENVRDAGRLLKRLMGDPAARASARHASADAAGRNPARELAEELRHRLRGVSRQQRISAAKR